MSPLELVLLVDACYLIGLVSGAVIIPRVSVVDPGRS